MYVRKRNLWTRRRLPLRYRIIALAAGVLILIHLLLVFIPFKPLKEFRSQECSRVFYDSQGNLLQVTTLADGTRSEYIPYSELTGDVKKIFIRAEDKRFYLHNGVDYAALTSAAILNAKSGQIVRGGPI